jgi:hypothetical protein
VGIPDEKYHLGKEDIKMPAVIPFIPLIAAAVGVGGSAYMSSEQSRQSEIAQNEAVEQQRVAEQRAIQAQKEAEERQKAYNEEVQAKNLKAYQENAYPTDAEIEAERAAGLKTLGSDRVKRLDQLSRTSALRGLGSGSGVISQGAGEIEGSYLEGLGSLSSSLSKLANTPKSGFTFPYEANVGANSGIGGANSGYSSSYMQGGSNASNPLGTALGYMMGKSGSLFGSSDNANVPTTTQEFDYSNWLNG